VLFTNHLSGSLRSRPLVVGQYLLLTELLDLDNTQVRAFELQNPIGFAKPDAQPVRQRELKGWSWFTPPLTPDRMTVVTDAGELGVFGLNLDNPDEALYPLILDGKGQCPRLAIDDPYRAMAIHSDEDLLWLMAGGTLRQIALDILQQKITTLWPKDEATAQVAGMPLHEATFDREAERIYLTTSSPDASRAEFTSVDANSGDRLWSRQLGVHPIGDPIVFGNGMLLVDRTGRLLQLSVVSSDNGAMRVNVIADDPPPTQEAAGELMRLRDLAGMDYLVLPVASGHAIAIRAIDPSLPFQAAWQTVSLPSTTLQGRPAVVDDYLMVPCSNGSLLRISLNDSARKPRNEQTYQWAAESTVASDDAPAVYPLASGQILLVLRDSLRWLDYATSDGVGIWKEQKHVLIDSAAKGELAITKDYLFIAGQGRSLYRVRRDGSSDPVTWPLEGRPTAGPYAIGDDIFVILDGRTLTAFSQSSEKAKWSCGPRAGRLCGRPFVSGKALLVTDDDGKAIVLRLDNGQILRELQLETGAIPVAASIPFGTGRILTPLADGTLSWHDYGSAKQTPVEHGATQ
jgi:outer membrane protein assembly factor BamB